MVDRVTRERFGTAAAQLAAGAVGNVPAPPAAATPTPAAAAPAAPASWIPPLLDSKDMEIARLTDLLTQRDAEVASIRATVAPYAAFLQELEREGLVRDGLLV